MLKDYFEPNAKVKFLHFFQWRSKNLHIISLDSLTLNSSTVKFKAIPLEMNFLIPDYHNSLITPSGEIYITGGQDSMDKNKRYNEVFTVDLEQRKLVQKASMLFKRDSHALCYNEGYIYAIGGISIDRQGKKVVTRTCEKYNILTDQWTEIAPLNLPICNHCACSFENKYIFCFGGRYQPNRISNNIFRYNIEKDIWQCLKLKINDQTEHRFGLTSQAACCQINKNQIFVFGGYHDNRTVSDQSFLLDCSGMIEEKTNMVEGLGNQDQENKKEVCIIKGCNVKKTQFAAPFWDKQVIVHNEKMYCLQNFVAISNPKLSHGNVRRLLVFDGEKWSNLN